MSLGPPRQGKSTTLRRVKQEIVDLLSAEEEELIHGSTGTVEYCSDVLVQGKSDPTTAEKNNKLDHCKESHRRSISTLSHSQR